MSSSAKRQRREIADHLATQVIETMVEAIQDGEDHMSILRIHSDWAGVKPSAIAIFSGENILKAFLQWAREQNLQTPKGWQSTGPLQ